jgi:hypothetical protein
MKRGTYNNLSKSIYIVWIVKYIVHDTTTRKILLIIQQTKYYMAFTLCFLNWCELKFRSRSGDESIDSSTLWLWLQVNCPTHYTPPMVKFFSFECYKWLCCLLIITLAIHKKDFLTCSLSVCDRKNCTFVVNAKPPWRHTRKGTVKIIKYNRSSIVTAIGDWTPWTTHSFHYNSRKSLCCNQHNELPFVLKPLVCHWRSRQNI